MAKYVSLDKLSHFLAQLKLTFVQDSNYVHTDTNYTQAEKTKLAGITEGANKYELPIAAAGTLGGVKIGANINIDANGVISVSALSWTNIDGRPTKLGDFTNDQNFITKSVTDLTNYYNKTNTYSKTEVDNLIGGLATIQIVKVDALPAPSQAHSNYIYLLANGGADPNAYDEYIFVSSTNKFEKIGSTAVDLSGYWSKTDLTECTNTEIENLFKTS